MNPVLTIEVHAMGESPVCPRLLRNNVVLHLFLCLMFAGLTQCSASTTQPA